MPRLERLVAIVGCLSFVCCASDGGRSVAPTPASPPPTAAAAPAAAVALTPDLVAPYFASGKALEAAQRYELDDYAGARELFREALASEKDTAQRERLELMIAQTSALLEDWPAAIRGFGAALPRFPLLTSWLQYKLARAHYESGNLDGALKHGRAVARDSLQGDSAALLLGDVYRARGLHEHAERQYRDYIANGEIRLAEARFYLGASLEALGRQEEAIGHYRYLLLHEPLDPWTAKASERIDGMPRELGGKARLFSGAEHLGLGTLYYDANRSELAIASFDEALKRNLTPDQRCQALFFQGNSWWKLRNRTNSAPILDRAIKACAEAKNEDLEVKSAYQAGRSYDKLDDEETSIARLELIEKNHPQHSYADDARLRQAESYMELGKDEEMRAVLASIPEKYPSGDMRAEAIWRLAWSYFQQQNYEQAIAWLEKQIELEPISYHWERAGQAQYWIARSYGLLGNGGKAVDHYRETIRLYPLSYYSLLALNRLRESHPDVFAEVSAEIAKPPANPAEGALEFKPRPEYQTPAFQRAILLLRMGFKDSATAELLHLGFRKPPGKDRLEDADAVDRTWAFAFLNHHAGRYTHSHWVTRWHVQDYKRHWPEGQWRERWRIAYPLAWWSLLERYAIKRGLPPELVIAFVREESAFDPLRESWANAMGLTQMIIPTAQGHAEDVDVPVTRENLFDPEVNVSIGTHFLQSLYQRWAGRIALIVPSYNTGETRVARWLKEAPKAPRDVFSENIYYDEPRRYNKRVTESFFVYSYLRDRSIPQMPNE